MKFVIPEELQREETWTIKAFRARPPRILLPPIADKIRDNEGFEVEENTWEDIICNGTIPTVSSLRVPPTHIGITSPRREKLIGVTNQEVSRRYMVKLQRDRRRNDQAVHRSLDNLPIKIRQMANDNDGETTIRVVQSHNTPFETRLRGSTVSEQIDWNKLHQSFESIPVSSSVTEAYVLGKQKGRSRNSKSEVKSSNNSNSKLSVKTNSTETFATKTSGYESDYECLPQPELSFISAEFPLKQATGFQGHAIKSKAGRMAKKKNVAFGSSSTRSVNSDDFKKSCQEIADSYRNIRHVHSSLLTKKIVKRINKLPPLQRIQNSKELEHSMQQFENRKNRIKSFRLSVSSPPVLSAPHQSFVSENTEYQQLFDVDAESNDESDLPQTAPKRVLHVDIPRAIEHSPFDSERVETSLSKDERTFTTVQDDLDNNSCTPLSYSNLQIHNISVSNDSYVPKSHNNICSLTDITERDESNLTQTTKTNQSDSDFKFSIRINFKTPEDAIKERSNVSDEINLPRWSERKPFAEGSRKDHVENSQYGEIYREAIQDVSKLVDQAKLSVDRINEVLPPEHYVRTANVDVVDENIASKDARALHMSATKHGESQDGMVAKEAENIGYRKDDIAQKKDTLSKERSVVNAKFEEHVSSNIINMKERSDVTGIRENSALHTMEPNTKEETVRSENNNSSAQSIQNSIASQPNKHLSQNSEAVEQKQSHNSQNNEGEQVQTLEKIGHRGSQNSQKIKLDRLQSSENVESKLQKMETTDYEQLHSLEIIENEKKSENVENAEHEHLQNVENIEHEEGSKLEVRHNQYWSKAETFFVTGLDDTDEVIEHELGEMSSDKDMNIDQDVRLESSYSRTRLEVQ